MAKGFLLALLLSTAPLVGTVADGAGGVTCGFQTASYPFLESVRVVNNNYGLAYYGGYGYGVRDHMISGGFGYVIADPTGESGAVGGFGGVISGVRILRLPIQISIVSWTGFGGIYTGVDQYDRGRGFFCASEELSLEVGLPITRWLMPVVYAGYQVAGNLVPGPAFQAFFSYTPVVGVRLAWGKFY